MIHTYINPDGETVTWETVDEHTPLDAAGVAATLNAVLGLWAVEDAANAVGQPPEALVAEAEAWAAAQQQA
jgi:hypothetical protein